MSEMWEVDFQWKKKDRKQIQTQGMSEGRGQQAWDQQPGQGIPDLRQAEGHYRRQGLPREPLWK